MRFWHRPPLSSVSQGSHEPGHLSSPGPVGVCRGRAMAMRAGPLSTPRSQSSPTKARRCSSRSRLARCGRRARRWRSRGCKRPGTAAASEFWGAQTLPLLSSFGPDSWPVDPGSMCRVCASRCCLVSCSSYRLCPADQKLTESCFQRLPLRFVGNSSLRWGGVGGEQVSWVARWAHQTHTFLLHLMIIRRFSTRRRSGGRRVLARCPRDQCGE